MFFLATVLGRVQDLIGSWGYPMVFALLCSCGLGVPLPEDIPLLLAGYFVANGRMNLAIAGISAWCGIIAGDCLLYTFGRKFGINITRIPIVGKEVTTERIAWVAGHFRRHGIWVVGVGRMVAGVRGAMVVTAGIIRYPFRRFIVADGLGAVVSGGFFVWLGYLAGKQLGDLDEVSRKVQHYEREVLIAAVLLVVLIGIVVWYRRRCHANAHVPATEEELKHIVEEAAASTPGHHPVPAEPALASSDLHERQ